MWEEDEALCPPLLGCPQTHHQHQFKWAVWSFGIHTEGFSCVRSSRLVDPSHDILESCMTHRPCCCETVLPIHNPHLPQVKMVLKTLFTAMSSG